MELFVHTHSTVRSKRYYTYTLQCVDTFNNNAMKLWQHIRPIVTYHLKTRCSYHIVGRGWNVLAYRSTEWRDRGIIPNEHLASGTYEPWSTWRSLNRLRVQKGRCRAMMKMWKLSHKNYVTVGRDILCLIL